MVAKKAKIEQHGVSHDKCEAKGRKVEAREQPWN